MESLLFSELTSEGVSGLKLEGFLKSEREYVTHLKLVHDLSVALSAEKKRIVSDEEFRVLFQHIPVLVSIHESFGCRVQQYVAGASDLSLGDLWASLLDGGHLVAVYAQFAVNSIRTYRLLLQLSANGKWARLCQTAFEQSPNAVSAEKLLSLPLARTLFYEAAVRSLLRDDWLMAAESAASVLALRKCLEQLHNCNARVVRRIHQRLVDALIVDCLFAQIRNLPEDLLAQSSLDFDCESPAGERRMADEPLLMGRRIWRNQRIALMNGVLHKIGRGGKRKEYLFWLFNDCLIYCTAPSSVPAKKEVSAMRHTALTSNSSIMEESEQLDYAVSAFIATGGGGAMTAPIPSMIRRESTAELESVSVSPIVSRESGGGILLPIGDLQLPEVDENDLFSYATTLRKAMFSAISFHNVMFVDSAFKVKAYELSILKPKTNCLQVYSRSKSFILECHDSLNKHLWFNALRKCQETVAPQSDDFPRADCSAPLYVPNDWSLNCLKCGKLFSTMSRRKKVCHHCGTLCCKKCLGVHKLPLLHTDDYEGGRHVLCSVCVDCLKKNLSKFPGFSPPMPKKTKALKKRIFGRFGGAKKESAEDSDEKCDDSDIVPKTATRKVIKARIDYFQKYHQKKSASKCESVARALTQCCELPYNVVYAIVNFATTDELAESIPLPTLDWRQFQNVTILDLSTDWSPQRKRTPAYFTLEVKRKISKVQDFDGFLFDISGLQRSDGGYGRETLGTPLTFVLSQPSGFFSEELLGALIPNGSRREEYLSFKFGVSTLNALQLASKMDSKCKPKLRATSRLPALIDAIGDMAVAKRLDPTGEILLKQKKRFENALKLVTTNINRICHFDQTSFGCVPRRYKRPTFTVLRVVRQRRQQWSSESESSSDHSNWARSHFSEVPTAASSPRLLRVLSPHSLLDGGITPLEQKESSSDTESDGFRSLAVSSLLGPNVCDDYISGKPLAEEQCEKEASDFGVYSLTTSEKAAKLSVERSLEVKLGSRMSATDLVSKGVMYHTEYTDDNSNDYLRLLKQKSREKLELRLDSKRRPTQEELVGRGIVVDESQSLSTASFKRRALAAMNEHLAVRPSPEELLRKHVISPDSELMTASAERSTDSMRLLAEMSLEYLRHTREYEKTRASKLNDVWKLLQLAKDLSLDSLSPELVNSLEEKVAHLGLGKMIDDYAVASYQLDDCNLEVCDMETDMLLVEDEINQELTAVAAERGKDESAKLTQELAALDSEIHRVAAEKIQLAATLSQEIDRMRSLLSG